LKKEEDKLYDLITIVIIKSVYKIFLFYHDIFREEKEKLFFLARQKKIVMFVII
jgi:hypothetical protein